MVNTITRLKVLPTLARRSFPPQLEAKIHREICGQKSATRGKRWKQQKRFQRIQRQGVTSMRFLLRNGLTQPLCYGWCMVLDVLDVLLLLLLLLFHLILSLITHVYCTLQVCSNPFWTLVFHLMSIIASWHRYKTVAHHRPFKSQWWLSDEQWKKGPRLLTT